MENLTDTTLNSTVIADEFLSFQVVVVDDTILVLILNLGLTEVVINCVEFVTFVILLDFTILVAFGSKDEGLTSDSLALFICASFSIFSLVGSEIERVCDLIMVVQSMKNVIRSMFISTIGVKSTWIDIFFWAPFFFLPLSDCSICAIISLARF